MPALFGNSFPSPCSAEEKNTGAFFFCISTVLTPTQVKDGKRKAAETFIWEMVNPSKVNNHTMIPRIILCREEYKRKAHTPIGAHSYLALLLVLSNLLYHSGPEPSSVSFVQGYWYTLTVALNHFCVLCILRLL